MPGLTLINSRLLSMGRLWRVGGFARAAASIGADIMYCPSPQMVSFGNIPTVTVFHDASITKFPQQFSRRMAAQLKAILWGTVKLSRSIIAISEATKADLVEIYKVPPEKVDVIYNGFDREIFSAAAVNQVQLSLLLSRLGIHRPYILHHGTIQPRKNLERLMQAYRLLLSRRPQFDFDLVLAGPLGWKYESTLRSAKATAYRGRVILTGALPDVELALLVKGASLSVIPSLYEGFCMPMVEAIACGVPTVVSNTSCFREVSGGVLRYFDPLSVEDIAHTIRQVLEDSALAGQLIRSGLRRALEFSWERCARETIGVLRKVYENRARKAIRSPGHELSRSVGV